MTDKRFSLLSFKPDWRHDAGRALKAEDETDDPVVKRYIRAKLAGFSSADPELHSVVNMTPADRGLIEALYLGGASVDQIAQNTLTQPDTVQLVLDLFFDVESLRSSPLLRTQLAHRELDRTAKSYKVYAAKNGWKDFLKQFFSLEEIMEEAPTINETRTTLMVELTRKLRDLGIYETGTPQSRELHAWAKLLLDLTREMRLHEVDEGPSDDGDIKLLMKNLRNNKSLAKDPTKFNFVAPAEDLKEDEDES